MIECGEEETDAGGGEVESRGWKVGVKNPGLGGNPGGEVGREMEGGGVGGKEWRVEGREGREMREG